MTKQQVRYRLNRNLVREVNKLCERIDVPPGVAVGMFFSQMLRVGGLPFRPSEFPALDEYGVTVEEAARAVESAKAEIRRDQKAGRLKPFKGSL